MLLGNCALKSVFLVLEGLWMDLEAGGGVSGSIDGRRIYGTFGKDGRFE